MQDTGKILYNSLKIQTLAESEGPTVSAVFEKLATSINVLKPGILSPSKTLSKPMCRGKKQKLKS